MNSKMTFSYINLVNLTIQRFICIKREITVRILQVFIIGMQSLHAASISAENQ